MPLSGKVNCTAWSVATDTHEVDGAFGCTIRVEHHGCGGVLFKHEFKHSRTFVSEREAVLAGLREGMVWIDLKLAKTIAI